MGALLEWQKLQRFLIDLALDAYLVGKAGKYCFGDTITAADIVIYPQVF